MAWSIGKYVHGRLLGPGIKLLYKYSLSGMLSGLWVHSSLKVGLSDILTTWISLFIDSLDLNNSIFSLVDSKL